MSSELLYKRPYSGKGKEPETQEFIIRVFPEEFKRWKANPHEVPLVEVVDAWEVYVAKSRAHTGVLERPSHAQLVDAFGSYKFEDVFAFMAQHGHLHNTGKHTALTGEDKGMNKAQITSVHGTHG